MLDRKPPSIDEAMNAIGQAARDAAHVLALADPESKTAALMAMAAELQAAEAKILAENTLDVTEARKSGGASAFIDRLTLTKERIAAMAEGVAAIAALPDPVGQRMSAWGRPNGLQIERVRTPLGVIGVIYESRPNVTADAAALCVKSGNAVILRGGSDSFRSCAAIHQALVQGLASAGLPPSAVQLVPTRDREAVGAMLRGLGGAIDVIIPRGGKSLVARVQSEARVPVFAHLEGNNHVYIHAAADLDMAIKVTVNAKMRRTGICGAAETLLVDEAIATTHLPPLLAALLDAGCAVRGDETCQTIDPRVTAASASDWGTEYLDAVISARIVSGLDEAMAHIARHGSHHTEAIITEDEAAAERFLKSVDSAIVLHNASTQFADGGEFGFGAEIGIATGRMHARGPVGVEQLTSFNYRLRGNGQVRP